MREIKFRAWLRNKKMVYFEGVTIEKDDRNGYKLVFGDNFHSDYLVKDYKSMVIMQYTGLKDKNGKEIYEGDIVSWQNYSGKHIERVEWQEYTYAPFYDPRDDGHLSKETEVIGNIYQNPELLEKEK